MDCIFCRIIAGDIPATVAYRDDDVIAIHDVNPQAPQHLLVIPVQHYADVASVDESGNSRLMRNLFGVAAKLGRERSGNGFRIVVNSGPDGGQTVAHAHVHVLAGRPMEWPPG